MWDWFSLCTTYVAWVRAALEICHNASKVGDQHIGAINAAKKINGTQTKRSHEVIWKRVLQLEWTAKIKKISFLVENIWPVVGLTDFRWSIHNGSPVISSSVRDVPDTTLPDLTLTRGLSNWQPFPLLYYKKHNHYGNKNINRMTSSVLTKTAINEGPVLCSIFPCHSSSNIELLTVFHEKAYSFPNLSLFSWTFHPHHFLYYYCSYYSYYWFAT